MSASQPRASASTTISPSQRRLPRHYFIADGTVVREVIGPLDPARMVAMLDELGVSR
jgi:hypothetical protein